MLHVTGSSPQPQNWVDHLGGVEWPIMLEVQRKCLMVGGDIWGWVVYINTQWVEGQEIVFGSIDFIEMVDAVVFWHKHEICWTIINQYMPDSFRHINANWLSLILSVLKTSFCRLITHHFHTINFLHPIFLSITKLNGIQLIAIDFNILKYYFLLYFLFIYWQASIMFFW